MKKLYLALAILVISEIAGISFLAYWRNWFWDAVNNRQLDLFIRYLIEFSIVVIGLVLVSGYKGFLINFIALELRSKLTLKVLDVGYSQIEGYQQRIQEDCRDYPALRLSIGAGLISAGIQLIIFAYIIISQSSIYNLGYVTIYTIIGTIIAAYIAKPLIKLNYNNQVVEAIFRQDLTTDNYHKTYDNNYKLFINFKYLQFFQSFFNQITVIIPLIILAVPYFHNLITFGVLMQLSSVIGSVIDQGSYFINSFDSINRYLSCKKRLREMNII